MKYPLVATNDGVFAYMKKLMESEACYESISPYFRQNFVLLRSNAEELARFYYAKQGTKDVTLTQIYDALCMTGELGEGDARKLMYLEQKAREELWSVETERLWKVPPWFGMLSSDDFSVQLLACASMRAVEQDNLQGSARYGAELGGPILMPYVEWLLRRSEALGIKRLYFIARDGFILKRMADALLESAQSDIKTYYIHGSRRAWRMPSYVGGEGELGDLIRWSYPQHIHTIDDLADVLQVSVDDIKEYVPPEFADTGGQLTFNELSACIYAMDKSDEFRRTLKQCLAEQRKLVVDYLKQEIDTSDDDFAFVELGGSGLTQICLARIMKDFYCGKIRTFFYKMDCVRRDDGKCVFYNFFPSRLKNDLIIEMVCRAPEGQTEGYKRNMGKVVPVKKEGEAEIYLEQGYGNYIKGIDAFIEAYAEVASKYRPEPSLKSSLACMDYISRQESSEVMLYFAGLPNRVTGREEKTVAYAPTLTKRQIQDIYVRHVNGGGAFYQGTDLDMSIKRSSPYIRRKAEKYKKYGWKIRSRWLQMFPEVTEAGEVTAWGMRCLPYSWLGKRVILYGAGKRGRRWYKELSDDKAIEVVQWLDKDYLTLKDELPVTGDMASLGQVPFDWVMIDFANQKLLESVIEELQQLGVAKEKIYYPVRISEWVSSWINYLHV